MTDSLVPNVPDQNLYAYSQNRDSELEFYKERNQLPASPEHFSDSLNLTPEWMTQGYWAGPGLDEGSRSTGNQNTSKEALEMSWDASTTIDAAWITDLGLSPVVLESLLSRFRGMASYFPFVRLPYDWTAASMAEDRPFLLLAAVAAASSKFHFHFVPGSQQTYQYLQIAISMVIDLRLDQEVADLLEQQTELSDTNVREACRAYLGCYYMSSIIAMSSGKPNNLQFHEGMLRCAMLLQQQPELETDLLIYPVTKVLQFSEEVCETYRSEGINGPRLHIHAERFMSRLEEWWSSLSTDLRNTVLLINSYYAVKIRIQEMGVVYCYGRRRPPSPKAQEDSTMLSAPPMVISTLVKCVNSTKEYLDLFLAIPAAEHGILPFSAWYQVILTVFVLYRLSVGLPEVPEWNIKIAQQIADLQEYSDTLLHQLQAIEPSPDREIPTKSLFSRLPEIIRSVKSSYVLAKENIAQVHDSRLAHHELKGLNNTASAVQGLHRCPALRYSSRHIVHPMGQITSQNPIAREVQRIEDETLWSDISLIDVFSGLTDSLSTEL
ncbi:uncharacterized protein N7477_005440 [Penicillium maclennaniae]|uniref:uncharacterized protein n=1 Tax=Penicillium maclennaniae TaxID=1343394 RepID=UPI00254095BE|nr:uncharacterized protein N7477_005440 [Penicillium maclennaniae]KAJ5670077.1 hypothetical protein N7477_005440 [Penicillium maclennaniae]